MQARLNRSAKAALAERALQMRHQMTPSEQLLWSEIRARKLGVCFRRQVPVAGLFVADFLAPSRHLIVEVDGAWHADRRARDARRDRVLERAGYRVLRIEAELVLRDLPAAVALIRAALESG
jgi:very-short-patch-repair endonuclease